MKRVISNVSAAMFCFILIGVMLALSWFDWYVWRVSHPGAPTWTYFFS